MTDFGTAAARVLAGEPVGDPAALNRMFALIAGDLGADLEPGDQVDAYEVMNAVRSALELVRLALSNADQECRFHGRKPPEGSPAWHGGCQSCVQPTRVRTALSALSCLEAPAAADGAPA